MIHTSYSERDTQQFAKDIIRRLGQRNLILLQGELGAGKTVVAQAIAEELGVGDVVTSPTYVLLKVYNTDDQQYRRMVHADLYRIEYNQHIDEIGLTDYLSDPETLVVVEWPERILGSWPHDAVLVRLDFGDKSTIRTLDF